MMPVLQMEKLRHRGIHPFDQSHMTGQWTQAGFCAGTTTRQGVFACFLEKVGRWGSPGRWLCAWHHGLLVMFSISCDLPLAWRVGHSDWPHFLEEETEAQKSQLYGFPPGWRLMWLCCVFARKINRLCK